MKMRAVRVGFILLVLLLGLGVPPNPPDDPEWEAYLNELNSFEAMAPVLPPSSFKPTLPMWFEQPILYFEPIYGEGMGRFPDRPTWQARRLLTKDLESRGLITREYGFERRPASDAAIDAVIEASSHEQWTVRAVATFILGDVPSLGNRPDARAKVLSALLGKTRDESGVVRAFAARAMGTLFRENREGREEAAEALRPLLRDRELFARYTAACALSHVGSANAETIEVLRKNLTHPNWWTVAGAVASLYRIGAPARSAVPDLLPLLRHKTDTVRRNTYTALELLDPAVLVDNPDAPRAKKDLDSLVPRINSIPK
jgi:HEAT repeat protein